MNDNDFFKYIDSKGRINPGNIEHKLTSEELTYLHHRFSDSDSIKETIHRIYYGIETKPICKYCNNSCLPTSSKYKEYKLTCGNKECINKNASEQHLLTFKKNHNGYDNVFQFPEVIEKIQTKRKSKQKEISEKTKQTCLSKYGVDNPAKVETIKEKSKQTCLDKYGVQYSFQSKNNKEKSKQTCLDKYGVNYYIQTPEMKTKSKQTCLDKYGVDNYAKTNEFKEQYKNTCINKYKGPAPIYDEDIKDKIIQTCIERYGSHPMQNSEIKQKVKDTQELLYNGFFNKEKCNELYGVDYPIQNAEIKQKVKNTLIEKYGVDHPFKLQCVIDKSIETKRKHNTFNTSKPEKESYKLLLNHYNSVVKEYKSNVYPFYCDFYIPEKDLYIECNFHWTHGPHKFNPENPDDILLLEQWKTKNTKFYNNAIHTWTIRDINKYKFAEQNNLNYKAFYTIDELKQFIKNDI